MIEEQKEKQKTKQKTKQKENQVEKQKEKLLEDWNPLDPSVLKDQRRAYDEMRERCPVAYSEFLGWSLFLHADIVKVLADPKTYSNVSRFLAIPNGMDPPVHGRYRAALNPNFEEQQLTRVEPIAREIATALLGKILPGSQVEFNNGFAIPFAMKTQCALLGWPEQQWESLASWVLESQKAAFTKDPGAGKTLAGLLCDQVKTNLNNRRSSPIQVADATNQLLNTEVSGVKLDDDQIVCLLRNWIAGHGTLADALGLLVLHLAQDTELQDRLRNYPSLIPATIEEILRVDGPLVANSRTTTREVKIQGRSIPKGSEISLMWLAANRDPRAFDEPNVVKIERNTDDGLVWGNGDHLCQGAPLARLEIRVAIEELLSQTKSIEVGEGVQHRAVYPSNGFTTIHLRFH